MYGPRSELVAHLLASWPQIVSLRIYYRANGTLLTIGLAMFVARQPIAEVVARPRDNLALSLTARQPRPLGGGCRAVPRDNFTPYKRWSSPFVV